MTNISGKSQSKFSHEPSALIVQKSSLKAALAETAAIFTVHARYITEFY